MQELTTSGGSALTAVANPDGSPPASHLGTERRWTRWSGFALRRLGLSVLVIWLAYTLSFLLLYVVPGDAALARLSNESGPENVSPEQIEELRQQLGLDDSLFVQYWRSLGRILGGDLGRSFRNDRPVTALIGEVLPQTLQLAAAAFVVATIAGALIAFLANVTTIRWIRSVALSLPAVAMGIPTFWVGIILIQVFSFALHLFPAGGTRSPLALVLPAVTLAIGPSALIAQVLAASLHGALRQPYAATTAPGKGAGRARVLLVHTLRNAAIPAFTVLGVVIGNLFAGSVIVETVFARSGIGRLMLDSVQAIDIPTVQGVVLLSAAAFVTVNLLVDLAYPLLDPRLRELEGGGS